MQGRRPTVAEIDLSALAHNFSHIRSRTAGRQVLAVVKADAYGHGAARVAPFLQAQGAELFGVALVEEALELRAAGVTRPILVLGGIYPGQEQQVLVAGLSCTLFCLETARRLNAEAAAAGQICPFHLKLDSGMGRVGVRPEELAGVLDELAGLRSLRMEGFFSHLALADEPGREFNEVQVRRFREALARVRERGFAPGFVHISNSAAIFTRDIPEANLVRPGIALYGGLPAPGLEGTIDLRPVMHLRTRVAALKTVAPGTGISYSHRFSAERPTVVATLPVGYADGYNRLLTNRGEVLVRGRRARVAGTVCMDWIMIDVTDVPGVAVGDEVTLLGSAEGGSISAEEWAEKVGSISYEVFCGIGKRVPRVYLGEE
ncbi:alanine racemase [Desulfuromonas versatilis]|uniref:Alanine racemase n=1 Tax=Desulfuromonas versatilis TaxID=2802975 RepID=A0ABM8HQ98_9BACT|nr:alanine racemase [Desulfuromonas versatilis]BCR03923.1 alanine racemase [Desulfuromonas versatilis]